MRRGFTLVELLVVLFIIGISLGLVGILINRDRGNLELKRFAKRMSATLRYARSHAISEKKVYSLIIQKSDMEYSVYTDIRGDEETEEPVPVIKKAIPEELQLTFNSSDADSFRIDFFPQGNSTGGIIGIENQRGINFFIIVNRVSGRVQVRKKNEKENR